MKKLLLLLLFIPLVSFGQLNIETKYNPPEGFERVYNDDYSKFLRQFPLKKNNIVKYHSGEEKPNYDIWDAVFDYDLGTHKYHECADAVIYLYSKYNWVAKNYQNLEFHTKLGTSLKYNDYLNGVKYKGNDNWTDLINDWANPKPRLNNLKNFEAWLKIVWGWANTYSIDEYNSIKINILDMRPGDFFVRSYPNRFGHAINVVDIVVNQTNNKKMYMLSQSYMPAQETHILINPQNGSVWYTLDEFNDIVTPEWSFTVNELKRFKS
jgi:hypothetical protein